MKKKAIAILCCVVVAGGAAVTYFRMNQKAAPVSAQPSQVTVAAAHPLIGEIALTGEFIGTVEPGEKVSVFPKVSGSVLKTYFEVGQPVKKGDLLYEIDPEFLQIQYDAAAAQIDAQKIGNDQKLGSGYDAQLVQAKSSLDMAQRNYNSARGALKDYNDNYDDALITLDQEIKKLELQIKAAPNSTPEEKAKLAAMEAQLSMMKANYNDLENDTDPAVRSLRTAYQNAQIAYQSAKEAYDLIAGTTREETRAAVDAGMKAAEVGLEAQAKQLEYAKVYAPIDGIVEQKSVDAYGMTAASSPAYIISNKNVMTVKFGVSESVISTLAIGEAVEIEHSGGKLDGTIIELPTMVDPQTGLFNVKANITDSGAPLYTGSAVKIFAATDRAKDALLVPLDCVYYDEQTPYVYLDRNGVAVKTVVTTGVADQKQIQILTGVTAADEVITTWHPKLLDGAVIVRRDAEPSAPAQQQGAEK